MESSKPNPLHRLVEWGRDQATVFHIVDALEKYGKNPYHFTIDEFYIHEPIKPTPEQMERLRKDEPLIDRAYRDCCRMLITNFHRLCLTRKDVNVNYALAIAPLIDPAYRSWLLEYQNKSGSTKAAALKDWMTYLESKDGDS